MEKTLLYFIVFGILIGFTFPPEELNDLDKYRLKGNVKSVMEIKYALSDDNKNETREKVVYQKLSLFDEEGYEAEFTLFKNGGEFLTSRYIFGAEGKQVGLDEFNPDGTLNMSAEYKFDDKGYRIEAYYTWAENRKIGEITENTDYYFEIINNDLFTKVVYTNEYRGYCTEEDYLKPDSTLSFKFKFKYDFRGNKLESAYYHGNGRLSWITKYTYDRYDNLIESRVYKSNRIAVRSEYKYQFDEVGNWVYRHEDREVHVNILTAGLDRANTVTERKIEYY